MIHPFIEIRYWSDRTSFEFYGRIPTRNIRTDKYGMILNSRGKTVHSMNGLVLNASESTDTQIGNRWNQNVMCEILSAFSSYRYFQNLTLLSVINLSKTRRRSAFLREKYNGVFHTIFDNQPFNLRDNLPSLFQFPTSARTFTNCPFELYASKINGSESEIIKSWWKNR